VDRHEYEVEVVQQAQQALSAVQGSLEAAHKEKLAAQNAVIAPAELTKRVNSKKEAEANVENAKASAAAAKTAKKDAEKAVSDAAEALKAAQKEEANADKALQRVVKKQASLSDALANEFELVLNNPSSCNGGKQAVKNLKALGKEFGMDNTLLETLPISCKKAPDTRSEFEAMVFTSLKGLINSSIADLGKQACAKVAAFAMEEGGEWKAEGNTDGVELSNCNVKGHKFPCVRGVMQVPAGCRCPEIRDAIACIVSHSARRVWDSLYDESKVVHSASNEAIVLWVKYRKTPITAERESIQIASCQKSSNGKEFTLSLSTAPPNVVDAHEASITKARQGKTYGSQEVPLWGWHVTQLDNGDLRLAFLFIPQTQGLPLPGFLLKKIIAGAPALIKKVVEMAVEGMIPRVVALTGPEPEETEAPKVALTAEEKAVKFFPHNVKDLAEKDLALNFVKFALPEKDECDVEHAEDSDRIPTSSAHSSDSESYMDSFRASARMKAKEKQVQEVKQVPEEEQISKAAEFFLTSRILPTTAEAIVGTEWMKQERRKLNLFKLKSQLPMRFGKARKAGSPVEMGFGMTAEATGMYHPDSARGKIIDDHERTSMRHVPADTQGLEISEYGRRQAAARWGNSDWWKGPLKKKEHDEEELEHELELAYEHECELKMERLAKEEGKKIKPTKTL